MRLKKGIQGFFDKQNLLATIKKFRAVGKRQYIERFFLLHYSYKEEAENYNH